MMWNALNPNAAFVMTRSSAGQTEEEYRQMAGAVSLLKQEPAPLPEKSWAPPRANYADYEDYMLAWYVARAIRRDERLTDDELRVRFETLRDLIMPDWQKRAHP